MGNILTSHAGCLWQPQSIEETLGWYANGEGVEMGSLQRLIEQSVKDIVHLQMTARIDIVNDGEVAFQHATPFQYMRLDALTPNIETLKTALAGQPFYDAFLSVDLYEGQQMVHASVEDALMFIAEERRKIYETIVGAGFVCQIDDAFISGVYDNPGVWILPNAHAPPNNKKWRDWNDLKTEAVGFAESEFSAIRGLSPANYRRWVDTRVQITNHSIHGLPSDRLRYHTRWGSWALAKHYGLRLDEFLDLTLAITTGTYAIEAINSQNPQDWRVFEMKRWPAGRTLVAGVVDLTADGVDDPDEIAGRIACLAQLVGRENLIAGTDCNFQKASPEKRADAAVLLEKLAALSDGARLANQRL